MTMMQMGERRELRMDPVTAENIQFLRMIDRRIEDVENRLFAILNVVDDDAGLTFYPGLAGQMRSLLARRHALIGIRQALADITFGIDSFDD